ncbi:uncharacterized protein TNCT_269071 [Trichonephila clavata]|uniref:Uncharacterized protein n=1 Tax=Trichonephila clavata TaxID=2740835 RepID=A0A8X6M3C9_TRICU|nr:uncharacterized protein TNCT_269071 [Trichonephila clavata]
MKQSEQADEQVVLDMPVGSVSEDSVFPSGPSRLSKMAASAGDKADPNGLNGIHLLKSPLEIYQETRLFLNYTGEKMSSNVALSSDW